MATAGKDTFKPIRDHYATLASGDPAALQRELGPMISTMTKQGMVQKDQIDKNLPRGGEGRLARENVDIATGENVGKMTTEAYNSSFGNLSKVLGEQFDNVLKAYGVSAGALAQGATAEYGAGNLYKTAGDNAGTAGGLYGKSGEVEAAKKGAQLGMIGDIVGGLTGMAAGPLGNLGKAKAKTA